jgi:hypothetical protein
LIPDVEPVAGFNPAVPALSAHPELLTVKAPHPGDPLQTVQHVAAEYWPDMNSRSGNEMV